MRFDGNPMPITRVEAWPKVGTCFCVWFDDPDDPDLLEHYRISSTVQSIEPMPTGVLSVEEKVEGLRALDEEWVAAEAEAHRLVDRIVLHMALEGQALDTEIIESILRDTTVRILAIRSQGR